MSVNQHVSRQVIGLAGLVVAQALCTAFFVYDVIKDMIKVDALHPIDIVAVMEILAAITLAVAIFLEARMMIGMVRREEMFRRNLRVARGALQEVIDEYFDNWRLTPAERDVATFVIKGCAISEVAELRGSAQGTVKTQLNAIYRKAGVSGRSQLVSLLIEDLMAFPPAPAPVPAATG